jgi:hypothetical protein
MAKNNFRCMRFTHFFWLVQLCYRQRPNNKGKKTLPRDIERGATLSFRSPPAQEEDQLRVVFAAREENSEWEK